MIRSPVVTGNSPELGHSPLNKGVWARSAKSGVTVGPSASSVCRYICTPYGESSQDIWEISASDQPKLVLNLSEAAELLGIKPSQLYEHTRTRGTRAAAHSDPHLAPG